MQPDSVTPGLPRLPKPCKTCAKRTTNPSGYCDEHQRATTQRKREISAYYHTTEWAQLRRQCLARDYDQCVICTGTYRLTAHHIFARRDGGPDILENLVTLCHHCHNGVERGNTTTTARLHEHLDNAHKEPEQ